MAETRAGDESDFGAILAEFEAQQSEQGRRAKVPQVGEKAKGTILSIGEETTFVDIGSKAEGMVQTAELLDADGDLTVSEGDVLEGVVSAIDRESGAIILRVRAGHGVTIPAELIQAREHGLPVDGVVRGVNKGGVEVEVAGIRAFCPISQLDLGFVEDANEFVGRRLSFRITRYEERSRGGAPDVVLSRKALLEEERKAQMAEARARLEVGKVVRGKVTSLASYGAFVDLGGIDGLLHVSQIGYNRVDHPKDVLSEGQEVEVEILKIEPGKGGKGERISLSMRSLQADPWQSVASTFPVGSVAAGRVVRLANFGAFVEIAPGVDGLLHISELGAGKRLSHPREAVQVGDHLQVRILKVETEAKRLSLALAREDEGRDEGQEAREYRERQGESQGGGGGFGSMAEALKELKEGR